MTKSEFLRKLEELLEAEPGTLNGTEELSALETWDSLVVLGFLAFADEQFGLAVPPSKVKEANTVTDLARLLGDRVTD